jgi:diguanylate cyclase (GGDEF)-like protein/PAS domain S-box-containing protein
MTRSERLALLEMVVDFVPDAIIVHDKLGRMVFFSESARALLQYSEDEMWALKPFGWIAPQSISGVTGRLELILHEGQLGFLSSVRCRDGTIVPTDVVTRRVDSIDGVLIVAVIRDIRERVKAERRLEFLAYHDSLTGLSNRVAFESRLQAATADARRHGDILGLAYIDLDEFKPINDKFGHHVGDAVLVEVGRRMAASVREQDLVARIGGDEFVLLLPRMTSAAEFEQVADRILSVIRQPIEAADTCCSITATIGFALFDLETDDQRTFVMKADIAMYLAKRELGRRWLQWMPEMGLSLPHGYHRDPRNG